MSEYSDYWESVQSIAKEAKQEKKAGNDPQDYIYESVDGSSWVIYTSNNFEVMKHSRNDNYGFEQEGSMTFESSSDAYQKLAYWAMLGDVMEAYDDLERNEPEEEDEEEEEEANV